MTKPVLTSLDARGVATVTLNRPEVGNAYNGDHDPGPAARHGRPGRQRRARALSCSKATASISRPAPTSSGSDAVRAASPEENERVSRATAQAVDRLNRLPVPTVALVQGGCFGGGTGIIAACDVVIAADNAIFSITEVRWGLTAAIIIPQLSDAISARQVRRYALTGERFGAERGPPHRARPRGRAARRASRQRARHMVDQLLENGPIAIAETKAIILESAWGGFDARHLRGARRQSCRQAPLGRGGGRPRLVRREARAKWKAAGWIADVVQDPASRS